VSCLFGDQQPTSSSCEHGQAEHITKLIFWKTLTSNTAVRQVLPRVSHAFSTFPTARMPIWISMMASCRHTPKHGETLDVFWSFGSPAEVLKMRVR
jgi:hypothetical protein